MNSYQYFIFILNLLLSIYVYVCVYVCVYVYIACKAINWNCWLLDDMPSCSRIIHLTLLRVPSYSGWILKNLPPKTIVIQECCIPSSVCLLYYSKYMYIYVICLPFIWDEQVTIIDLKYSSTLLMLVHRSEEFDMRTFL